jgi:NTE family protein
MLAAQPSLSRRRWLRGAVKGAAWGAGGLGLAGAGALVACSESAQTNHTGPLAPHEAALPSQPRVAWVFSSGGPRGFVHVGVVQALQELGLKPDLIVGASAGALAAVLCAAGMEGTRMRELALSLPVWELARVAWGAPERLSTLGLRDWVGGQLQQRSLQQLAVPVACAAWNRDRQRLVPFTAGDAGLAVAASCAIEGQFAPVLIHGEAHVDADLHQPMPVRLARSLGAQRVLAVDASAHEWNAPPGTERWRPGDLRKRALTQPDADAADVLLHPDLGYYASISQDYRARVMAIGYRETLAQADRLRALHG